MSSARFLLCRDCGVLHRLDDEHLGSALDCEEDPAIALAEFEADHAGHLLEQATRASASSGLDRPVWDPMATLWFFVRSGNDELLVRAHRSSVEEPRSYRLEPDPPHRDALVEIDAKLVRRALDRHFYPHAVSARKLDRFVDLLCELVRGIDAASIETSFDDPDYADAGIAALPDPLCGLLLEHCAPFYDAWENERLAEFVAAHRAEDGALALRVHRAFPTSGADRHV